MEDVVIEFGESFPLLATSIDKEEMDVDAGMHFQGEGKVVAILGT